MDLMTIVAIVAPISGAGVVATIALVRFARRFGSIEQSIKLMAKEREKYSENKKEINTQLKDIGERMIRIETILNSNMEGE